MTKFEVAWTDALGKVVDRMFDSYDDLCDWLKRFEVKRGFRASVKETEQ